jgi:hypothetical protein
MSPKPTETRPKTLRKKVIQSDLGFSWGMPNTVLMVLGIGALLIGYVTLSKGSMTFAPVILSLGYLGLIPAALLIRGRGDGQGE